MSFHQVDYCIKKRRRTTEYHDASDVIGRQSGFRDIKSKPEENVKKALCGWLEANGCKVYWEKANAFGKPIFSTDAGTCERPDLLTQITDVFENNTYYALEVKDGSSSSNVYDSFPQVLRYAKGKYNYFIDGNPITVSGYFSANLNSINGHLFSKDTDTLNNPENFSDGRKEAIAKGELPENEHILTEQFLRLLWRMAKEYRIETRIGALLSTKLNGAVSPAPLLQYADIKGDVGFQGYEVLHKLFGKGKQEAQ